MGGLYRTVDAGAHWTRVWNQDRVESVAPPRLAVVDMGSMLLVERLPASRTLVCRMRGVDGRTLWEGPATSDAAGKASLPMSPHGIFQLEISGVGSRMVLRP